MDLQVADKMELHSSSQWNLDICHFWSMRLPPGSSSCSASTACWDLSARSAMPTASSRLELTEQEMMFLLLYLKRIRILNVRLGTAGNVSCKHLFYSCHQHNLRVRITYGEKSLWIKGRTVQKYTGILKKEVLPVLSVDGNSNKPNPERIIKDYYLCLFNTARWKRKSLC